MCASLHRASDWIYIFLADPQRSPGSEMFTKQSGSRVQIRTRPIVVNSLRKKRFVFSVHSHAAVVGRRTAFRGAGLVRSPFSVLLLRHEMRGHVLQLSS